MEIGKVLYVLGVSSRRGNVVGQTCDLNEKYPTAVLTPNLHTSAAPPARRSSGLANRDLSVCSVAIAIADGYCNDCGDESHGGNPAQIATPIVRSHACTLRAIGTVFKSRWLTRASDERPRLVSVAQRCRMTVGRHRRLTMVKLGRRSDAVFPLILKHYS